MKSRFVSKATQTVTMNYEVTMMTLKGETFAGFKIQRQSVFYFVIDVASVIDVAQTVYEVNNMRKSQIALENAGNSISKPLDFKIF